jgi:hypothetical protein
LEFPKLKILRESGLTKKMVSVSSDVTKTLEVDPITSVYFATKSTHRSSFKNLFQTLLLRNTLLGIRLPAQIVN